MDHPEPFRAQIGSEKTYTGDIAARPVEAGDEAELDRVSTVRKYNRNRRGRRLGRERRSGATSCKDHAHISANQILSQLR